MSQVSVAPAERVFRRHPLRTAGGSLLLTVVFAAAVLFLLPKFLPPNMTISTRGTIVLVVVIAITLAVWIGAFWFRNIRVIVRADSVEIGRPGGTETYSRATTAFRSKITEHRTNGFRTGTTRALIAWTGGRETVIELPGFTRTTFNELMAQLTPISAPPAVDPVEAARARAKLPTTFTVDASKERSLGRGFLIAAIVFAAATIGTVLMAFTPGFLEGELSALILIAPMAGVAAIGFGIGAAQRYRVARTTPTQISLSHHGIRIGEVDHPYAQLTRVWLTPPAYPIRRIRIERAAGRTITHVLGSTRITMTPDYAAFLEAVRAETAPWPGLLSLDLE